MTEVAVVVAAADKYMSSFAGPFLQKVGLARIAAAAAAAEVVIDSIDCIAGSVVADSLWDKIGMIVARLPAYMTIGFLLSICIQNSIAVAVAAAVTTIELGGIVWHSIARSADPLE